MGDFPSSNNTTKPQETEDIVVMHIMDLGSYTAEVSTISLSCSNEIVAMHQHTLLDNSASHWWYCQK